MKDSKKEEIELFIYKVIVIYSNLKLVFQDTEYKGNRKLVENDITFKGFCETEKTEYHDYSEDMIKGFHEDHKPFINLSSETKPKLTFYTNLVEKYSELLLPTRGSVNEVKQQYLETINDIA